jgi:hypothetical protein
MQLNLIAKFNTNNILNKMKKNKIVSLLTAAAMTTSLTNVAYSQTTFSGYIEATLMNADHENAINIPATKSLGSESLFRIDSKGKLSNGMDYSLFQEFESDESFAFHQRQIAISPAKDITLFYSFDSVKGSELARTLTPYATERHTDVTGQTGVPELIDITSGENYIGFDINNLGPAGQLSVAYNPNMDSTSNTGSDRLLPLTNSQSGYSVGYKVTPVAGLTIGAGLTKIDSKNTSFQDVTAKSLGFTFAKAPFAIGAQRVQNEGLKTTQAATQKDQADIISATYAVSKEITLGLGYLQNERTLAGVKSSLETESRLVALAYNLGPVVTSLNYEQSYDTPASGTVAPTSGRDITITKIKVKANF